MTLHNKYLSVLIPIIMLPFVFCGSNPVFEPRFAGGTSIEVVSIHGVVIGTNLKPAANAKLKLRRYDFDLKKTIERATGKTSSDGTFTMQEDKTGSYLLEACDSLGNSAGEYFSIQTGVNDAPLDTIKLRRTGSLSMTIIPNISSTNYYTYNVLVLKNNFENSMSINKYDTIIKNDTTYVNFKKSLIPPDTYKVIISICYYDAPTIAESRMKYALTLFDTSITINDGEVINLPTYKLMNPKTDEMSQMFTNDSIAYCSLCNKLGLVQQIPVNAINTMTWRIEQVSMTATKKVTFNDIKAELNQLDAIKTLSLFKVQGDTLPPEIFKMTNLKSLFICDGNLSIIPIDILKLRELSTVGFQKQAISTLPDFVYNIEQSNIHALYLTDNPIEIPDWNTQELINKLNTKTRYISLSPLIKNDYSIMRALLDSNGYQKFNISNFAQSGSDGRIYYIYFPIEYPLSNIPKNLGTLDSLKRFVIGTHSLTSVPAWFEKHKALQYLHLPNGNLSSLPSYLGSLPNLKHLNVSNNKLIEVPSWITNLNRSYFQSSIADFSCNFIAQGNIRYSKINCLVDDQKLLNEPAFNKTLLQNDLSTVQSIFSAHANYSSEPHSVPYNYFVRIKNDRIRSISITITFNDKENLNAGVVDLINNISQLDSLTNLTINANNASSLTNDSSLNAALSTISVTLPNIKSIHFRYGYMITFPDEFLRIIPNIQHIDFAYENLTSIPEKFKTLRKLTSVNLFGNFLKNISAQDTAWMNTYCKQSPYDIADHYSEIITNSWQNTMR